MVQGTRVQPAHNYGVTGCECAIKRRRRSVRPGRSVKYLAGSRRISSPGNSRSAWANLTNRDVRVGRTHFRAIKDTGDIANGEECIRWHLETERSVGD